MFFHLVPVSKLNNTALTRGDSCCSWIQSPRPVIFTHFPPQTLIHPYAIMFLNEHLSEGISPGGLTDHLQPLKHSQLSKTQSVACVTHCFTCPEVAASQALHEPHTCSLPYMLSFKKHIFCVMGLTYNLTAEISMTGYEIQISLNKWQSLGYSDDVFPLFSYCLILND